MWVEATFFALASGLLVFAMARREKTSRARALEQCVRALLLRLVGRKPGARLQSLCRTAKVSPGTVRYHLKVLEGVGLIWAFREEGARRFFPAGVGANEAAGIALLRKPRIGELVERIRAVPGQSQHQLAQSLAMRRKTFREYADRLTVYRLIDERHEGSRRRYYPTSRLNELMDLLGNDLAEDFSDDALEET